MRADVRLPRDSLAAGRYRLIVQSYDAMAEARTIPASVRPRGSVQRAVTADDLEEGVRIELIELGNSAARSGDGGMVVAWLELGDANLEFDARRARPAPGSVYGIARSHRSDAVEIVLDRKIREG